MLGQGSDARPSPYREHDVAEYLHGFVAGVRLETECNELIDADGSILTLREL